MNLNQIHSIIKDYRAEPSNGIEDATFVQTVLAMMKNQEWLLPIQKEALSRYFAYKAENAIIDKYDVTNKYDR
jgi:hypothetical protein